jgi:pimeloyl-ACP methyl ester carboxylesterase
MEPPRREPERADITYQLGGRFYRMAVHAWGPAEAEPVLCVHGLSRTGRDFDILADALSDRFRVLCPDLPGRGASDWLADGTLYQPPFYVQVLAHLLSAVGRPVRWVGTSLGGICGMLAAAMPGAPVSRMVLNDIGPAIPAPALARIGAYLRGGLADPASLEYADLGALERHLREVHAPFGPLTDAQWAHMARTSARALPDGRVALHYDPKIAVPVADAEPAAIEFWPVWEAIRIPMLTIHGASSDLLLQETVDRMVAGGSALHVVKEAGHAPALMDAPTIAAIRAFLEAA